MIVEGVVSASHYTSQPVVLTLFSFTWLAISALIWMLAIVQSAPL